MERTALLYLCGLLIYGIEASDSSCRLKDLTVQSQCCTPKTYIEVNFFLRLRSNGGCDSLEFLDQGIRFEVGIVKTNEWIPIRYYTATIATRPSSLAKLVNNTHVEALSLNYNSTFPLQVYNSTEPIRITEYLCGEQFVTPVTRFRWFQRYSGASLADRNTWSLDNLTITVWNGSCYSIILEEDFENVSQIMTDFAENTGGVVVEPPCGETASGKALYFQGNVSGGISRRRLKMHRTNFTSPTSVCYTPPREGAGCSLDGTSCTSDLFVCSLGNFDCSCKVGYRREGFICVDVDECDENLHSCSQLCVNSEGTYHCTCHPGFRMDDNGFTCSDIDECSMGLNNCSGECHNIGGSFECLCSPGFQLEADGVTCTPTVVSVGFEQGAYNTLEGEKVEICVVMQNGTVERAVNILLFSVDQTATVPQDYIAISTHLLFVPSETRRCINITLLDDSIVEDSEKFVMELASSEVGILLSPNKTTISIQDTDRAEVGFIETVIQVSERNRSVELCAVAQNATLERGLTVTLSTQGGSAAAGEDYTATTVDLYFTSTRYSQCTTISLVDDFTLEGVEMFTVNLNTSDAVVALMQAVATVIITDNDYVDVGLDEAAYTVLEDDRSVEVCVSIVAGTLGLPVNILLATTDGTATASSDYRSVASLLSFDSSISHVCVNISMEDDQLAEQDEHFSVAISTNESYPLVHIEIQEAVVTIMDNDVITIGLESATYSVSEGGGSVRICAMVQTGLLGRMLFVTMLTQDGTATAPGDFNSITVDMMFDEVSANACTRITIVDDDSLEGVESFNIEIVLDTTAPNTSTVHLRPDTATVYIYDNDDVSVGLEHTTFTVSEDVGDLEVCAVVISGTVERTVALSMITTDSSAAAQADYDEVTTEMTFSAGSNRSCTRVNITDDDAFENAEDFTVGITTTDPDVSISHNNATVVITDNDWVRIGFVNEAFWVEEDEPSVEVCAAVTSGTLERKVIISLTAENGSAHDIEDYIPTHALLTFQPHATRICLNIIIVNDTLMEDAETFIVKLTNEENGVVLNPARAMVQVQDDDAATIGFMQMKYSTNEATGVVEVAIGVLHGQLFKPVTVQVYSMDGSATSPADFVAFNRTVTFNSATTEQMISITINDDQAVETSETFYLRLSTATTDVNIPLGSTVEIMDDDGIALGFEMESYEVRENEGPLEICAMVIGNGSLERDVEITMATLSGTALASLDYTATSTLLTFTVSEEKLCVGIAIIDDQLVEDPEELQVQLILTTPELSITVFPDSTTVSILDNDRVMIGFENSHLTVRENEGSVDICTVLSGSLEKTVKITIHTENDTATESSDYSAVSTELRFSSNTTRLCTTILIEEDNLFEERERFSVHLECSDPVVLLSPAVAAVVITDSGGVSNVLNLKQQIAAGQVNATNAVNILNDLLNNQLSDGQTADAAFRMAFVETATSLLDKIRSVNKEELLNKEEVTAIASSLLTTLDRFALKSFNSDDGGELQTETLKLQVQTANVDDNLTVSGIEKDGNEIVLPPEIIRRTGASEVRVASYYFQNMTGILPDTSPDLNGSRLVSPVISSVLGCGGFTCGRINTTNPVRVVLRHENYQTTLQEPSCVFWEFVNEGNGRWSKQGCDIHKEESNTTTTVCLCTHLTHFAILFSPRVEVSEQDATALGIIGYVGVSISLVCLLLTVAAFLFLRSLWGMRNYIHINLCISLFVAQLIFVASVDKTSNEKACQAIAVLLHYFFLVTFMWMLMEGVVLYVALVKVFVKKQKYYIAAFTIVSYGLPALYMGVTVPLGFLLQNGPHYGSDAGCWLRYDTHFIWAFIAPVILIILANTGFFIMAICIMYRHDKRSLHKSKLQSAKHWLRSCISLVIIMGISWIMGVLAFHEALLAVSYIFTIFIAFQGLFIFILFVPVSKQVRDSYRKWWRSKVAGSDFLSQFFSGAKIERRFTRTSSLGSSIKTSKHQQCVVDFPTTSQADGSTLENTSPELRADVRDGDTKTPPPLPAEYEMKSMEIVFTELHATKKITATNVPLENNTQFHEDAEERAFSLRETGDGGSQDSDEECTAI